MKHETILAVEDNPDILNLIAFNLEAQGYTVIRSLTGGGVLELAQAHKPDLILLDVMLPGMDGLTICRKLKQKDGLRAIPVIMLTAKGEESDIVAGLELGADDYITKPFSPKVLVARVRALLRRGHEEGDNADPHQLALHGLTMDLARHTVRHGETLLDLSATEFAILRHLLQNPGWVFSRTQLIDAVRGGNYPVTERAVDVQILGLRKKLGELGPLIETVRGVGYRLRSPD